MPRCVYCAPDVGRYEAVKVSHKQLLIPGSMAVATRTPGEDEVVKSMRKNAPVITCVLVLTLAAMCMVMPAPSTPVRAAGDFVRFNPPPFDFNDAFYAANGIDVNHLDAPAAGRFGFFRRTGPPARDGQVNWVIDNSNADPDRKNIRILATTGGYIDDGTGAPTQFISLIAFLLDQTFFTGVANKRGIQMSDIVATFEAYAAHKQVKPD